MTKYGMASSFQSSISNSTSPPVTATPTVKDAFHVTITGHKLNRKLPAMVAICYDVHSWQMEGRLHHRGIDVPCCPDSADPKHRTWNSKNNMIMLWLINSEIGENSLLYSTTKEIWETAPDTYPTKDNESELFAIESHLQNICQGDSTITSYFTTLSRLWQRIYLFEVHDWKRPDDEIPYRSIVEKDKISNSYWGSTTLWMKSTVDSWGLKLYQVFKPRSSRYVLKSHGKIMLGSSAVTPTAEGSALAAPQSGTDVLMIIQVLGIVHNPQSTMAACNRGVLGVKNVNSQTILETCWKIHGNPLMPTQERRANAVQFEITA